MPDAEPQAESSPPAVSSAMKAAAWVIMVVPVLGLAMHLTLYAMAGESADWKHWLIVYSHGWGMIVTLLLTFANLVCSWLHYRKTGMGLAVAARILTYLWILSLVLIWKAAIAPA